jgi:hypothetical protein
MLKKVLFKSYKSWTGWVATTGFFASTYACLQMNALHQDALRNAVGVIPCLFALLLFAESCAQRAAVGTAIKSCLALVAPLAMLATTVLTFYSVQNLEGWDQLRFTIGQLIVCVVAFASAVEMKLISVRLLSSDN